MHRESVILQNQEIAYYDSRGEGSVILFLHENSLSAQTFIGQFTGETFKDYRLIAFDFPGHGFSDWATRTSGGYSLETFRNTVLSLLEILMVEKVILVGHGLGGHVALNIALQVSVKGIFLFGTVPLNIQSAKLPTFKPGRAYSLFHKSILEPQKVNTLIDDLVPNNNFSLKTILFEIIKQSDPKVRGPFKEVFNQTGFSDELAIIDQLPVPFALIASDKEPLVNYNYVCNLKIQNLWQGKVKLIQDCGHIPQLEQTGIFNLLLLDFIKFCSKGKNYRNPVLGMYNL